MNTAAKIDMTMPKITAKPGGQDRGPDQRPRFEVVDVVGGILRPVDHRLELRVDVAAAAEPGQPVVRRTKATLSRRP